MPPLDSPLTTYSDTTPQKRVITDVISILDPSDAPLVERLGGLDGAMSKFRFVNWPGNPVEWLEDTLGPLADALDGSITSVATTITVDDASVFQEGHIIEVDSEQMWISAVAVATEILTVTRNYSGTQATHADDAAVTIVGMARLEGDESDDIAFTDRTVGSNYTQIFHKEIKVSRTQDQITQYGISEESAYQGDKAVPELMRLVERQAFRGARKAGSATTPRAFGGLGTFITDNTVNAGGAMVQADFDEALRLAYEDGGAGNYVAPVESSNMVDIKGFLDSSSYLRVDVDESTVGMDIERIRTPFGIVDLMLDRWSQKATQYLINPDNAGFLTLQPFMQEPLSKGGDYEKSEVIAELTFCVKQDKSHAVITGVT